MIINGNLKFHTLGQGELLNAVLERMTTLERTTAGFGTPGRIAYDTDLSAYYYSDGTAWVPFATGGSAASQADFDALIASLGTFVSGTGAFNGAALDALGNVTGSTSLLNALTQMDLAITDALEFSDVGINDLNDATITTVAADDFLVYDGTGQWRNETTASVLAKLNLEIGTDVQAWDAQLDALAAMVGTGFVVQTGANTYTHAAISSTTAAITVTNGDGVAAGPTLDIDADLETIAALAHTGGEIMYSNAGTWAAAGPGATSGVQAYDASLASIAALDAATGTMLYTTGAETFATSPITAFALTMLDDADASAVRTTIDVYSTSEADGNFVDITGDTMTGDLVMSSSEVTGLPATPTQSSAAASKAYVDSVVSANVVWLDPIDQPDLVDVVATEPLTPIVSGMYIAYNDGAGTGFPQSWGGTTVNEYDMVHYTSGAYENSGSILGSPTRIGVAFNVAAVDNEGSLPVGMVKDDLAVYAGSGDPTNVANWDYPHGRPGTVTFSLVSTTSATKTFVISGDVSNSFKVDNTFVVASSTAGANDGTYTIASVAVAGNTTVTVYETVPSDDGAVGTVAPEFRDGITSLCDNSADSHFGQSYLYSDVQDKWVIISGPGTITAGVGVEFSGAILNVNLGGGITELPTDEVGVDHDSEGLILSLDGSPTVASTDTTAKLRMLLDGTTLSKSGTGLKVATGGITDTEINANADISLSKLIAGTDGQVIVASAGGVPTYQTMTGDVTIDNAGATTIGADKVLNSMLLNDAISLNADGDVGSIALGGTLTFDGDATQGVDTSFAAGTIGITVADATTTTKGVAQFDPSMFSVTAGVVSFSATSSDLTDITADTSAAGEMLVSTGTTYTPTKIHHVHTGASLTTHTVNHAIGQQYCQVTVVDATDNVIIPESITFTDANSLVVTFNTAIACKVIVTGVAGV